MSEKQAKRLRGIEARETALETAVLDCTRRLTACESSLAWAEAEGEVMALHALESTSRHLHRSRKRAHDWEETAWRWKAIATTAIAVLAVVVFGIIIL